MEKELKQFKYNFLNLRWLIVIAAAYMAIFSRVSQEMPLFSYVNLLVFFFILSNVFLYFISLEYFKKDLFRYFIFIGDVLLVSLGIFFTQSAGTDFFLLYFLVIVITALGKDIKVSIIATIVSSLLYFWLLLRKNINIYDVNIYMRIPFLFVVGLFTGFLSETVKKESASVKELRIILTITDIINENMDYDIMVELLDPLFKKIEVISDWEIGIYDNAKKRFKLLRQGREVSAKEFSAGEKDAKVVEVLIEQARIYKGKNFIYFPQARDKKVTGFLRVKPLNIKEFSEQDYDLFMTLAGEFALMIERNKLYKEIKHLADIDRLTDLYNYGYFLEKSDIRVKNKKKFAVIMIDLDNFKKYNDTYGHVAGNACLKNIAKDFKKELKGCLVSRYGGDEFSVLRDGANEDLEVFLKSFKKKMDVNFIKYGRKEKITMSIGYALFPRDGRTSEEVLLNADNSLYRAKRSGKNKIQVL